MITRRIFLKDGALTLVGLGTVPAFLYRTALAGTRQKKVLVSIFQRGAADGLNIVVPFAEKEYYARRPSIAIPAPGGREDSARDLDGFFGFHPALDPLLPLYRDGQLALVHAAGSPHSTRSHFDAQDFMESAAPGNKKVSDGWLNRYLRRQPDPKATAFRAVGMGTVLPRALKGEMPAVALNNISQFDLNAGAAREAVGPAYQSLYDRETNSLLAGTAREMFEAIEFLKRAQPEQYQPRQGVEYPRTPFGERLKQVAQLIKAGVGLEIACLDIGGWDHHVNEGGATGQLANLLRQLGQGLAAFHRDLGDRMEDVMVLTMSEFGRTVRENGNGGTDHGHANVMFVLGGKVRGGRVYGDWPGLAREQLYEGRDLALTTDFRDVFAEVLSGHLNCSRLDGIFPGFPAGPERFKGLYS